MNTCFIAEYILFSLQLYLPYVGDQKHMTTKDSNINLGKNIWEYKRLTRVRGADRKFCGFASWCQIVIPRAGIFYPHRTLIFDFFSCIPFDYQCFILEVAFITIHNDTDIGHFEIWRPWCRKDVNLMTKLRNVLYNQCTPNSCENFIYFYPTHGLDNMDKIRISIPSENLGFPCLVYKKM